MIAIKSEQPLPAEERAGAARGEGARGPLVRSSAVSQKSVELVLPEGSGNPLHRSRLAPQRSTTSETQSTGKKIISLRKTKNQSSIESTMSLPNQKSLEKKHGSLRHQKAVAVSEVALSAPPLADDRKALREALYQGIFHRHRRTIFAVGSFLRMLKSKTSNYDSIRSDSDEI